MCGFLEHTDEALVNAAAEGQSTDAGWGVGRAGVLGSFSTNEPWVGEYFWRGLHFLLSQIQEVEAHGLPRCPSPDICASKTSEITAQLYDQHDRSLGKDSSWVRATLGPEFTSQDSQSFLLLKKINK